LGERKDKTGMKREAIRIKTCLDIMFRLKKGEQLDLESF